MLINYASLTFNQYTLRVDYSIDTNSLIITSTNAETGESFANEQLGELNGLVKFDQRTVSQYIVQSWGKALPAFSEVIGFIYSVDDLNLRKHLLPQGEYEAIRAKYPELPIYKGSMNSESVYQVRIVSYVIGEELDIRTGKPIAGSKPVVVIDNEEANWYTKENVPFQDVREVAPEFAETLANIDPKTMHYFDPIEADIWRKYGQQ